LAALESSSARLRLARLVVGYGAIASALPYLALKLVWLAGGSLGVADERMMRDASMVALNVLTAGMDLVAIGIALAFTHEWGTKIPAWLILPPMWVATGLLAKFVAAVPVVVAVEALKPDSIGRPVAGPVEPWVYTVVYGGFVGIGVGLMLAFIWYVRARWGDVFEAGAQRSSPRRGHSVEVPLAAASATMAVAVGGLHLAWALGAKIGVPPQLAAERTIASSLINALDAGVMIAGAAGVLMMVHGISRRVPSWIPLTMAWVGGAFLFAWGLWHMVVVRGNTPLARGGAMVLVNIASLVRLIAGLVIGILMLFVVAESESAVASPVVAG
jgi:hypothetical protein